MLSAKKQKKKRKKNQIDCMNQLDGIPTASSTNENITDTVLQQNLEHGK